MTKTISEEQALALANSFPIVESSGGGLSFPRLGMTSKDVTESTGTGKNKKIKVVQASGSFYIERAPDYEREYLDVEEIEAIIVYYRKQLSFWDSSLEQYISSPFYDTKDQVIPLYLDKRQIAKGTPEELQKLPAYAATSAKGKPTSKLKENYVLFVLYKGEMFQYNLSTSSKWEFLNYARKTKVPAVVTRFGSVEETYGDNTFRKNVFEEVRPITQDEADLVTENQEVISEQVESDRLYRLEQAEKPIAIEGEVEKAHKKAAKEF